MVKFQKIKKFSMLRKNDKRHLISFLIFSMLGKMINDILLVALEIIKINFEVFLWKFFFVWGKGKW